MNNKKFRDKPCETCGCGYIHKNGGGTGMYPASMRLRQLRFERGWSMRDLAEKAGIAANTVLNLENGYTSAQPSTLKLLALALGISEAELAAEDTDSTFPAYYRTPRLREYRERHGLTMHQLAEAAHVSHRTVRKLEAGGMCIYTSILRIANALNVSREELLGR